MVSLREGLAWVSWAGAKHYYPDGLLVYWSGTDWRVRWGPAWDSSGLVLKAAIPLWIPLLLVLGPTLYLWFRGRSYGPGCCPSCGRERRG